jgi:pyruvate formate lyase activating enzyme
MKEKFKIKGFIEMSMVDWEDKITAMVFLPNCNFKCPYCHNADLVLKPNELPDIDIDDILEHLKKYEGWIEGVCITGGEPTIHKWLPDLIRYIREKSSLIVKIDTNGTNPDMLEELINDKLVDAVSMDVKAPLDDIRYFKAAGATVNLDDIRRSIDILKNAGIESEFRTTIHPKLFTRKDIEDLANQLKGVKAFKLQNFNKLAPTIDPELEGSEPFPEDEFEELEKMVAGIVKG